MSCVSCVSCVDQRGSGLTIRKSSGIAVLEDAPLQQRRERADGRLCFRPCKVPFKAVVWPDRKAQLLALIRALDIEAIRRCEH